WWGKHPDNWRVECGEAADILAAHPAGFDRVILDMLAPWEIIPAAAQALVPGGVFLAYVATTTQLSRCAEDLKATGLFTGPEASETLVRTWHLEGLAVRPDHRMVAHTGFLILARRLAGPTRLTPASRPAKGAYAEPMPWENSEAAPLQERPIAEKKLRKVRRDLAHRADVEESGVSTPGEHSRKIAEKIAAEIAVREAEKQRRAEELRQVETQGQVEESRQVED
ncbi:tRNA (adenine-N1)-methyltransferase, partial [Actinotignum sanguinis]|nr:tRNA (adenine-N1)-methyltransferase [Actinotignum sanguinis]